MHPRRRQFVPERDREKIHKQILKGVYQNTSLDQMGFPEPVRGDRISVIKQCAEVGVQKYPITRKWAADDFLVSKGYKDLEFHSRCGIGPYVPEADDRQFLIGPKQRVEIDQSNDKAAIFDEYDDETSVRLVIRDRRMTAAPEYLREVPVGYKTIPAVYAKTWDVTFVPKRNKDDDDSEPPQFIKLRNVTLDSMLEIYKHSDGFFITRINEPKLVKKKRRVSAELKLEIHRQSIMKRQSALFSQSDSTAEASTSIDVSWMMPTLDSYKIPSATNESQPSSRPETPESTATPKKDFSSGTTGMSIKLPTGKTYQSPKVKPTIPDGAIEAEKEPTPPLTTTDKKCSSLSSKDVSSMRKEESHPAIDLFISDTTEEVPKFLSKSDAIRDSEEIKRTQMKPPEKPMEKLPQKTPEKTPEKTLLKPPEMTLQKTLQKTPEKTPEKAQKVEEDFVQATKTPMKLPTPPQSKPAHDAKQVVPKGLPPKRTISHAKTKTKAPLPKELKHIMVVEDVDDTAFEDKPKVTKEKQPLAYSRRVDMLKPVKLRTITSDSNLKPGDTTEDSRSDTDVPKKGKKYRQVKDTDIVESLSKFKIDSTDGEPTDVIQKYELRKRKKKPKKEMEDDGGEPPDDVLLDKEHGGHGRKHDFLRSHDDTYSEEDTRSAAWSKKRAVKSLGPKKIVKEKRKDKMVINMLKGQVKSLHDSDEESHDNALTSLSNLAKKKLTGIPEYDIPDIEPLNLEQFDNTIPTFEERRMMLSAKAMKTHRKGSQKRQATSKKSDSEDEAMKVVPLLDSAEREAKKEEKQKLKRDWSKALSKLELFKSAKDKSDDEKEALIGDLVDLEKPLRNFPVDEEEESKSPFQFSDINKLTGSDEEVIQRSTSRKDKTDDDDEGVVGEVELYETTSRKKTFVEKPIRIYTEGYKKGQSKTSSLRAKYGLRNVAYLNEDSKDSALDIDEAMYTYSRYSIEDDATKHQIVCKPRFQYPMELSALDGLTPLDYLEEYTIIPSRRLGVYQRIFAKHAVKKQIPISLMKQALDDIVVGPFSKEEYMGIMSLVDIHKAQFVPWNHFKLICCLTDRLMQDTTTPSEITPKTDFLQIADGNTILHMLKDETFNMPMVNLLNAVASCQIYNV